LSKAAATTVIPVTAIGAEKLSIWATSWSRAAPTAQIITAAAAQAIARRTTPDTVARKLARPVSRAAFAFSRMTMTAISASPRLLA
jgi:ABC-type transport system involved in multi-copper enzyme maturation permease subunit